MQTAPDTSTGERAKMVLTERVETLTPLHPPSLIASQKSHLFPEKLKGSPVWGSQKAPNPTPLLD